MESELYGLLIGQCENQEAYEDLVKQHQSLYRDWQDYILPKITEKRLKVTQIAAGCGVSRPIAGKFSSSIPARRQNVIMLAMMLGMSVEETDEMLVRWAKFQRLYPKHPKDAIWIYLLRRGGSKEPKKLFDRYYAYYEQMKEEYLDPNSGSVMDTFMAYREIQGQETDAPLDPETDLAFQQMVSRLLPSFQKGYAKLMDYIEEQLLIEEDLTNYNVRTISASEAFREHKSFLRKYHRVINELRKTHTLPSRMFLIALGIHLNLDTDGINRLLEMAGMGPLCPKDRLEGSIAFYLEELYCQMPSIFHPSLLKVDPISDSLRDSYDMVPEEDALFGMPMESLSDYIKRRLEETNIFGKDEDDSVQDLLQML